MATSAGMPPTTLLLVTLEAQEWNVVFAGLQELPMRLSRQVFDKILAQVQDVPRGPMPLPPIKDAANGEDHPEPYYRRDQ